MGDIARRISIEKLEKEGYLVLKSDDLDGFKKKAPELFSMVFQEGHQVGQKKGREAAEHFNRVMARVNQKKVLPKEQVPEKNFLALVAEYQAEKQCSKVEAITAIVKSHPEEHKEFNRNGNKPRKENIGSRNGTESRFRTLVSEYQTEHKCSKTKAIIAIVKSHPEEHKEYIAA